MFKALESSKKYRLLLTRSSGPLEYHVVIDNNLRFRRLHSSKSIIISYLQRVALAFIALWKLYHTFSWNNGFGCYQLVYAYKLYNACVNAPINLWNLAYVNFHIKCPIQSYGHVMLLGMICHTLPTSSNVDWYLRKTEIFYFQLQSGGKV